MVRGRVTHSVLAQPEKKSVFASTLHPPAFIQVVTLIYLVVLQFNNGCLGPLGSCGYSSGSGLRMGGRNGCVDSTWTDGSVWDGSPKEIFQGGEHRVDSTKAGGISPE